jgi:hypothetical protein
MSLGLADLKNTNDLGEVKEEQDDLSHSTYSENSRAHNGHEFACRN